MEALTEDDAGIYQACPPQLADMPLGEAVQAMNLIVSAHHEGNDLLAGKRTSC